MSFLQASNSKKSSIFITGGASGIGLGLATRLVALGHEVIIAGRRQAQLDAAKVAVPQLITIQGDVATDAGRKALHKKIISEYPQVNVLINNAGVATPTRSLKESTEEDWEKNKSMLAINVDAPIHLAILFLPHLLTKDHALIANVTSILAFFQFSSSPVYCATKAALHSFTISLRHQLKDTAVHVVDIIPPAVATDMNKMDGALDVNLYTDDVIEQLLEGKTEFGYKDEPIIRAPRDFLDGLTAKFAGAKLD